MDYPSNPGQDDERVVLFEVLNIRRAGIGCVHIVFFFKPATQVMSWSKTDNISYHYYWQLFLITVICNYYIITFLVCTICYYYHLSLCSIIVINHNLYHKDWNLSYLDTIYGFTLSNPLCFMIMSYESMKAFIKIHFGIPTCLGPWNRNPRTETCTRIFC